jgi:asparagine synthase (glutamine-hydrolysing)
VKRLVPGISEPETVLTKSEPWLDAADYREAMMWLDTVSYLPGDILAKVDRAAMSVSLETRIPLLDHRVVEFSWRVPAAVKNLDGRGKWPLRALLERHVPTALIDRPKKGFGVPINRWLRQDLREWAEDLLSPAGLGASGLLDVPTVRARWRDHLEGRSDQRYWLWNVLMFQAWLAERAGEKSHGAGAPAGGQQRPSSSL